MKEVFYIRIENKKKKEDDENISTNIYIFMIKKKITKRKENSFFLSPKICFFYDFFIKRDD